MSTIEKYLLQCQSHTFPIQYMGLPLSIKKPPRESFMNILANVQKLLPNHMPSAYN
jgi:hypothetical protein